jgi:large subunit ribosomal protein L22
MSPRKVSVVAALVRGRSVSDALVILSHTSRRPAVAVSKVVASARANAENNHNYRPDSLKITEISVTTGPRLKRFRAISRGQAQPYMRRSSHIRVIVDGDKRQPKKPAAKQETKS